MRKRVDIVSIKMVREKSELYDTRKVNSPKDAADIAIDFLKGYDRECLIALSLNTKNEPTNISVVSIGSLNASIVHPREVFKTAILSNAASLVIAHNHPSQDVSPSKEDINITQRLKEAGKILGIDLLDHLIVSENKFVSMKEKGIL